MRDPLARLVSALSASGIGAPLGAEDVLDALWLARWIQPASGAPAAVVAPRSEPDEAATRPAGEGPPSGARAPAMPGGPVSRKASSTARSIAAPGQPDLPTSTLDVSLAAPPELAGKAAIAGALRRSLRKVAVSDPRSLDEAATVLTRAREGLPTPVFRRRWVPRFAATLVVDRGGAMEVWREVGADLLRALRASRAFRDVRAWEMDTEGPTPVVRPGLSRGGRRGIGQSGKALCDPTGRRLIFVFTDCGGAAWHEGAAIRELSRWAGHGPVALIHALPETLWSRTALGRATALHLRPRGLFARNTALGREPVDGLGFLEDEPSSPEVPFPVLALTDDALHGYGQFLSGGSESLYGVSWSPSAFRAGSKPRTSAEQLHRFRGFASPITRRLARHLAAVAPLTLPVIRLVREALVPGAQYVHEAELLLSGVLVPDGERVGTGGAPLYDFHPEVRAELLEELTATEAVKTMLRVWEFIEARGGTGFDIHAVLADPRAEGARIDRNKGAFARVAADVFLRIGGDYAAAGGWVKPTAGTIAGDGAGPPIAGDAVGDDSRTPSSDSTNEPLLTQHEILTLHDAAVTSRVVMDRIAMMAGIDYAIVATIETAYNPSQQVLADLNTLCRIGVLDDGGAPIAVWLGNATLLAESRSEAEVFRAAWEDVKRRADCDEDEGRRADQSLLSIREIRELYSAARSSRLVDQRDALLAGIHNGVVASIPSARIPVHQIFADLDALSRMGAQGDAAVSIVTWLENAARIVQSTHEAEVFRATRDEVIRRLPEPADVPLPVSRSPVSSPDDAPPRTPQRSVDDPLRLSNDEIWQIQGAAVSAGLFRDRNALLAGMQPGFVAGLIRGRTPAEQMLLDLDALNAAGALVDGSIPFVIWLKNAIHLAGAREESIVFSRMLERVSRPTVLVLAIDGSNLLRDEPLSVANLIEPPSNPDALIWVVKRVTTIAEIHEALVRHKPTIVHVVGGRTVADLFVQDERGEGRSIMGTELADLFQAVGSIRMIVLGVGNSNQLAANLIRYVDAVVSTWSSVVGDVESEFFQLFYDSLGRGESVQRAYEFGRSALLLLSIGDAVPDVFVLHVRDGLHPDRLFLDLDVSSTPSPGDSVA